MIQRSSGLSPWLAGGQTLLTTAESAAIGDVVVYREGGEVRHSAVIFGLGIVYQAAGTEICDGKKATIMGLLGAWPNPGTTVEYWRPTSP